MMTYYQSDFGNGMMKISDYLHIIISKSIEQTPRLSVEQRLCNFHKSRLLDGQSDFYPL